MLIVFLSLCFFEAPGPFVAHYFKAALSVVRPTRVFGTRASVLVAARTVLSSWWDPTKLYVFSTVLFT